MILEPDGGGIRQRVLHPELRALTPNERFWLEVIRLSSWDTDPAPTLERVQQLRRIFEPTWHVEARCDRR